MALDQILHQDKLRSPAAILAALDRLVRTRLRQDGRGSESDDGLDCGICVWKRDSREVMFSGAGISLTYIQDSEAIRLRGSRRGIGFPLRDGSIARFDETVVPASPGTCFYLMTDGLTDQMGAKGAAPRRLLGHKAVGDILLRHSAKALSGQIDALREEIALYRGHEKPRDDMTIIAFRPQPSGDLGVRAAGEAS
jgi:serine phosphatase RsbU (regulator of sigma subunit)